VNELTAAADTITLSETAPEESRILTFAEIKDLIEQGKTDQIPNNKYIPNVISVCDGGLSCKHVLTVALTSQDALPSESTAQLRKKPWEFTV
jgi:hypothetical protein